MQRYRSHKIVRAAKIGRISIEPGKDGAALILSNEEVVNVDQAYIEKHDPQVGGYYVEYPDGYTSWSPKDAFESGYTLIEDIPVEGYHAKEGLWFSRMEDKSVQVAFEGLNVRITLDADTWASMIASMSCKGDTAENYQAAVRFHKG